MKRSRTLVDPALASLIDPDPTVELTPELLALGRAAGPILLAHFPDVSAELEIGRHEAPGPDGAPGIRLLVVRPRGVEGLLPCIFHIHGGGYVMRSMEDALPGYAPLVHELGCMLVSVEYRLAPETVFPGQIEDCYAGLAWTFANAARLGIDLQRIGVMGESAGGGLAAALALLARDRGDYPLAFQHLIYPMLDDRTCVREPHPVAGEYIWTPHNNRFGWTALLGHEPGGEGVSPYAAPARAGDLAGLPPSFVSTGALDLFLEEDIDYARRLMRAGVPCELHVYPGAVHAFDFFADVPLSRQAWTDAKRWLRAQLKIRSSG